MDEIQAIKREQLREPELPIRVSMDEEKLDELAASIRIKGVMQPLLVRVRGWRTEEGAFVDDAVLEGEGRPCEVAYEIIDGHRRYIASGMVGVVDLPCIVRSDDADAALDTMAASNLCREDNTPAEEGILFLQLAEKRGWGIEQLMRTFHRSEHYINERVKLVQGDPAICEAVAKRLLGFSVAKVLLKCTNEAHRRYLLNLALTHGCNVRTAEGWLQQWKVTSEQQPLPVNGGGAEAQVTYIPPPGPVCLWCQKDRYQADLVSVVIHRWELDQLLELLLKVGIHSATASA